jgi:hypothetical protein
MSGNRANASARNKRAGGADINSNGGPSPMPGQRGPGQGYPGQGQQMAQPKLSISDAIGLITLRLGRVEQLVQTIQTSPNDPTSIPEDNGNNVLVDKQVFDNIVKRLETLEKQKVSLAPGLTPPQALAQAHAQAQAQVQSQATLSQLVSIQKYDIFVKDVAKEFKEMKELIAAKPTATSALTNEIAELKEMLLKLQTFTMETNSKLVNMIFSDSAQFEILEQEDTEEIDELRGEEIIDDFNMKFFGSASGSDSTIIELSQSGFNLKEMIQQELQNENVVEELSA